MTAGTHSSIDVTSAADVQVIPVLASLDIERTKRFYIDVIGCSEVVYETREYLIVRRPEIELHFWLSPDKIHPENTSCYIRGGGIVALFAEFTARKVPGLSAFTVRPWNMKEFTIHDIDGNLLRFGCEPDFTG